MNKTEIVPTPPRPPKKRPDKSKKIVIGVFIFLAFLSGWYFGHADSQISKKGFTPSISNKESSDQNIDFSIFWRTWDKLAEKYDGNVDYQKMLYGAIKGMTESLGDPYTVFMDPEEAEAFQQELSGSISGIGAEIGIKKDNLTVITPLVDSPAIKAGLKTGDVILKINDDETFDMSLTEAVMKIRGEVGTKVTLTIGRGSEELVKEITREKITIESVRSEIKEGNIGYIEISRFDEDTPAKLREVANDFTSKGVEGIVLDLRNNPGGFLDSSISVASEFIKSGIVVIEKKVDGSDVRNFKASGKGKLTNTDIPLVVLVNEGSASASEIVAGAVRDHKRGILIGEKTFGKGSVQEVEGLGQNASIRITVAHWFTPNGDSIDKVGLNPDIEVKLSDEDFSNDIDPQLDRAIEEIKSKL